MTERRSLAAACLVSPPATREATHWYTPRSISSIGDIRSCDTWGEGEGEREGGGGGGEGESEGGGE